MPNHFHAIIVIGENEYNSGKIIQRDCDALKNDNASCRDAIHRVSTTNHNAPIKIPTINKFGSQSKNLASIIRGFKSAVTQSARKTNPNFAWQSNYHDHIIRNDKSFQRIDKYIEDNPKNWGKDKFNR